MRLQKIIAKSLLGIGLLGLLSCEKSTQEQETAAKQIYRSKHVAEFPMYARSGAGVSTGDMNGDGRLDIIVATCGGSADDLKVNGQIYVFLNNGDGTYSPNN